MTVSITTIATEIADAIKENLPQFKTVLPMPVTSSATLLRKVRTIANKLPAAIILGGAWSKNGLDRHPVFGVLVIDKYDPSPKPGTGVWALGDAVYDLFAVRTGEEGNDEFPASAIVSFQLPSGILVDAGPAVPVDFAEIAVEAVSVELTVIDEFDSVFV